MCPAAYSDGIDNLRAFGRTWRLRAVAVSIVFVDSSSRMPRGSAVGLPTANLFHTVDFRRVVRHFLCAFPRVPNPLGDERGAKPSQTQLGFQLAVASDRLNKHPKLPLDVGCQC